MGKRPFNITLPDGREMTIALAEFEGYSASGVKLDKHKIIRETINEHLMDSRYRMPTSSYYSGISTEFVPLVILITEKEVAFQREYPSISIPDTSRYNTGLDPPPSKEIKKEIKEELPNPLTLLL